MSTTTTTSIETVLCVHPVETELTPAAIEKHEMILRHRHGYFITIWTRPCWVWLRCRSPDGKRDSTVLRLVQQAQGGCVADSNAKTYEEMMHWYPPYLEEGQRFLVYSNNETGQTCMQVNGIEGDDSVFTPCGEILHLTLEQVIQLYSLTPERATHLRTFAREVLATQAAQKKQFDAAVQAAKPRFLR